MKKALLLLLIIFVIVGCKQEPTLQINDIKTDLKELYEVDKTTKIYSEVDINYNYKKGNISLSEALNKQLITIDMIFSKMEINPLNIFNDGGTIIYNSKIEDNHFANRNFYIVKCKKLNPYSLSDVNKKYLNENIYIGLSEEIFSYCEMTPAEN